jgi:arginyl-tRNA synthetase
MQTIPAVLTARLRAALTALTSLNAFGGHGSIEPVVTPATDARFGDYQTNIAMLLAKERRANPRQIAQQIIAGLDVSAICEPPEIAGAGFINFRVTPAHLQERLAFVASDPMLGVPPAAEPQSIVVDFSSPNVAKPMHVGHIRSTILGDTLTRVARFLGHRVIADNHIGDWGTQFGKVIYGWKHWRDPDALARAPIDELVRLYKEANALSETDPLVLGECREELVKLQQGDPANMEIWRQCVALSWQEFKRMYEVLDVHFDQHLGESAYNKRLEPLVTRLLDQGIAEISQGAVCIFFRDDPALADKPCLIRKGDGGYLYATTDLATIEYRIERWHPDQIWYVVGAPQQLHFDQVFAAARRMGIHSRLRFIPFGSILGEDRKLMKTRSGENVSLKSLLAEAEERALTLVGQKNPDLPDEEKQEVARAVGIGAVKYADLSQARMTDYIFSWERMLSFQGNTAPYLQNAHVRVRSIFRKLDIPFLKSSDKWGAIEELVEQLVSLDKIKPEDKEAILEAVRARERTMSTGIGFGIAIPHASSDRVKNPVTAFGRSSQGIDFESLDNSPVRFVILFIVPKDQFQSQLGTLAEIARFLNDHSAGASEAILRRQPTFLALREPGELTLARKLVQFGEVVPQVLDDFRPNILANYLFELANTFHGFYEACPVLKAEEPARSTRLALCDLTGRILQKGLELMGIQAPEKM